MREKKNRVCVCMYIFVQREFPPIPSSPPTNYRRKKYDVGLNLHYSVVVQSLPTPPLPLSKCLPLLCFTTHRGILSRVFIGRSKSFPIWERSCDHGLTRHGLASSGKFKSQKLNNIRLFPNSTPRARCFSHSVSDADRVEK